LFWLATRSHEGSARNRRIDETRQANSAAPEIAPRQKKENDAKPVAPSTSGSGVIRRVGTVKGAQGASPPASFAP
jgi:hypothetical protein